MIEQSKLQGSSSTKARVTLCRFLSSLQGHRSNRDMEGRDPQYTLTTKDERLEKGSLFQDNLGLATRE